MQISGRVFRLLKNLDQWGLWLSSLNISLLHTQVNVTGTRKAKIRLLSLKGEKQKTFKVRKIPFILNNNRTITYR